MIKQIRQQPALSLLILLIGLVLFCITFLDGVSQSFIQNLDPDVIAIMHIITYIGDSLWSISLGVIVTVALFIFAHNKRGDQKIALQRLKRASLFFTLALIITGIGVSLIKNSIGRARPYNVLRDGILDFNPIAFKSAWASFPSGHATTCAALTVALSLLFPRYKLAFITIGIWGALSRVFIGAHWPSDIVAGFAFGGVITLYLARVMFKSEYPKGFGRHQENRCILPKGIIKRAFQKP